VATARFPGGKLTTGDNRSSATDKVTTGKEENMRRSHLLFLLAMILFVSACASPRFMKPTTTSLQPTEGKAVVRFLFPRTGGYIWDGETFLGTGWPSAQFDYYASPGKHIFFTTAENKAFLEADLDGGKTYYIVGRVWSGWGLRVGLVAVNRGGEYWDKVKEWEQSLTRYELDPDALAKYEAEHKDKMRELLAYYESTWKHEHGWPRLNREDGR
jgi:hypothetical protein